MKNIFLMLLSLLVFMSFQSKPIPNKRIFVKGGSINYRGKEVLLGNFEISKYEVSNKEYAAFLNAKQIDSTAIFKGKLLINILSKDLKLEFSNKKWSPKKSFENYPIVMVNYYGAVEYCNWAGGKLPTEAEWFYAAKGGMKSQNYLFAGGNKFDKVGWFANNSAKKLHTSGEKLPNELGIYDMSGNVWEWCLNDTLKGDTGFCFHAGGSWYAAEQPGRLDARYGNTPLHFSNSVGFRAIFPDESFSMLNNALKDYQGKPWNNMAQQIPGKIQCEWFDLGGEGVAYHDKDNVNNGSGKLNPANGTFLNEFRMKEGVDISYTKARDIDNSPYNVVEPTIGEFYVGWTMPNEWINYSIKVNETGYYTIDLMYTASGDGGISLLMDGIEISPEILVPSTRDERETIAWRQWHHWNKITVQIPTKLMKGKHLLTIKTVTNGNMNYDYFDFKRRDK